MDFKQLEAVQPTMELLKQKESQIQFPIWFNADVAPGPGVDVPRIDGEK